MLSQTWQVLLAYACSLDSESAAVNVLVCEHRSVSEHKCQRTLLRGLWVLLEKYQFSPTELRPLG